MLLAIDVGNTETVVGLFADDPAAPVDESVPRDGTEPAGLAHHWRLSTVDVRTADEHALLLTQLLDLNGLDIDDAVTGIAVTSSVPLVTANLRQMASRWFDVP
ncbi:MAG TPA: type III pantothenate kinase, partial [Acidimicrobiales bacterium]